jgi:hypothetical protein
MVDPKGLTLWGGFKKRWTSSLETTFILWITSHKKRFFSAIEEKLVETRSV